MKYIKLSQNKVALIDDEDFNRVNKYRWHYGISTKGYESYAKKSLRIGKKQKSIYLHRFILNIETNKNIDHINGNHLDNRKSNLRICTDKQNQGNRFKIKIKSSTYKGVCWTKNMKKWRSRIVVNKRDITLGYFDIEIDAAKAYNKAAIKYFGEFAKINSLKELK